MTHDSVTNLELQQAYGASVWKAKAAVLDGLNAQYTHKVAATKAASEAVNVQRKQDQERNAPKLQSYSHKYLELLDKTFSIKVRARSPGVSSRDCGANWSRCAWLILPAGMRGPGAQGDEEGSGRSVATHPTRWSGADELNESEPTSSSWTARRCVKRAHVRLSHLVVAHCLLAPALSSVAPAEHIKLF